MHDLTRAIQLNTIAKDATPEGDPELPGHLSNLANWLGN